MILYGRALGLDHAEAEDVLHDTFAALFRLERQPLDPERYVIRAIRHRALNYRRSLWRRIRREFEAHQWFEAEAGNPEAETMAREELERLPTEQREVIVLKVWHGMTFGAIAELVEASPNTVAARYRYGLAKIRKRLEEAATEELSVYGKQHATVEATTPLSQS